MKKVFLLLITSGVAFGSFAQSTVAGKSLVPSNRANNVSRELTSSNNRTTASTDTLALSNVIGDTIALYYASGHTDSGFVSGPNGYGFKGFAERFDFNGDSASIKVLGVASVFSGVVNPASTKNVVFNAWTQGPKVPIRTHLAWSGFPATSLAAVSVPVTNLGISDTAFNETFHYFATPTAYLSSSFFVGYTIAYDFSALAGDTLAVLVSTNGERTAAGYTVAAGDTTINDQVVTQHADGTWHDNLNDDLGFFNDYYLFPIVQIGAPTSVASVTRNAFTFYGNFPNPAVNSTDVKFALASTADVTITVSDINGRAVSTISQKSLPAGAHTIAIETANMPAGEYVYIIRTSAGDGIASKLSVIK